MHRSTGWEELSKELARCWQEKEPWRIWDSVSKHAANGPLRLVAMDPDILQALVQSRNIQQIAKYYHHFDKLAALRRSPESKLLGYKAWEDGKLDLSAIMQTHATKTIALQHEPEANNEYLWWHLRATM